MRRNTTLLWTLVAFYAGTLLFGSLRPGDRATNLLEALHDEYDAAAGRNLIGGPSAEPSDFTLPSGTFRVAYEHDHAVACGGLKTVCPGVAEVKSPSLVPV